MGLRQKVIQWSKKKVNGLEDAKYFVPVERGKFFFNYLTIIGKI